jgi:hypothetical protein
MEDIFEGAVEEAAGQINSSRGDIDVSELPQELRDEYSNIESLVAMNPDVVETEEYKDLIARIDDVLSGQASDDEEYDDEEYDDEEYDDEEYDDEDDEDDEDESFDEDVFGTLKREKRQKRVEIDFEVPDEMLDMLGSKYGIEDPSTFFTSVDTWRQQAQDGAEVRKKYEAINADIQQLPPDLRQSIVMWADGEDYSSVFTMGQRLDFGSDFEEQDVESLVEHFLPEDYQDLIDEYESNEDMTDEEFEDKMYILAKSTKRAFNQERKAMVESRVQYENSQSEHVSAVKNSALDSVDLLSKSFPNFSKSELNRVRNYLVEGKVDSLFYNPDGTYTEEAAEMVANALFGSKMRGMIETLAKRKGESEVNQRIVDSSPKSVRRNKSTQQGKANVKAVQHLSSVVVSDDPYA